MERTRTLWQGLGITIFGAFFIILTSVLYILNYVKGERVFIFYGLSVVLVAIGVVMLLLSRRIPQQITKNQREKA